MTTDRTSDELRPSDVAATSLNPRFPWIRAFFRNRTFLAILLGAIALSIFPLHFQPYYGGDTQPAQFLPMSVLREVDLDFDEFAPDHAHLPFWFKEVNGRVISFYPIVPGLMNVPVNWVAMKRGIDIEKESGPLSQWSAAIISAMSVSFMFVALSYLFERRRTAILGTLVYAFGTLVWSVTSQSLWQHGPSLFWLTAAIALLAGKNKWLMPWAGFYLGMAVWNRPTNIVFAVPLTIYVLVSFRWRILPFLATAAVPAALMAWYSLAYWGSLSSLGQGHRPGMTHGIHVNTGFNGPLWSGLYAVLFNPNRGLFVFTPVFLISVAFIPYVFVRARKLGLIPYLVAGAIIDTILFAKWSVWYGGHSFGYRMLIETIPVWIILFSVAWERLMTRRLLWALSAWMLILPSVYFNFLGATYYPSGFNTNPSDIDGSQERLWDVKDGELARLNRKFLKDYGISSETKR